MNSQQASIKNKIEKLQKISKMYSKTLGLEFKTVPGFVQCIFTLIDPTNPEREFSFLLSLGESSEYTSNIFYNLF